MRRHHLWAAIMLIAILGLSSPAVFALGDQGQKDAKHEKAATVNSHCPIMGVEIDSENVPANLVREFSGKQVGFCCTGCTAKWDQLSETEKGEKLEKALKS